MTKDKAEEEKFILRERDWTKKQAEEKFGDVEIATRHWRAAKFRHEITQKALDDFYEANPEMKTKEQKA